MSDEANTTVKGLGAIAANPVLGVTAPLGAAILWGLQMIGGVGDELDRLHVRQEKIGVQVGEFAVKIELATQRLQDGSKKVDEIHATATTLRREVHELRETLSDLDHRVRKLEGTR